MEKFIDLTSFSNTIEDELKRRDFTINAMAFPLHEDIAMVRSSIIDPVNGLQDLDTASIKAVNPHIFDEDPIRLIRAVRLVSKYHFSIEKNTFKLIKYKSHLVSNESQERVRDELMKILKSNSSVLYIELMDGLGLLSSIIPELDLLRDVIQPKEHHWDVFNHSINSAVMAGKILESSSELGFVGTNVPEFPGMLCA